MKNIELTEEHKSKLLEMCEKLFPEYKIGKTLSPFKTGHIDFYNHGTKLCPNWTIYSHSIHWFEFCHEYLSEEILGDYNMIFCKKEINPIDYLYEEFKKLK